MIGCTELKIEAGASDVSFEVELVDINGSVISDTTFNGYVYLNVNLCGENVFVQVTSEEPVDKSQVFGYFSQEKVVIVIPYSKQTQGEVFFNFAVSGKFIAGNSGIILKDYETLATKLCNFI